MKYGSRAPGAFMLEEGGKDPSVSDELRPSPMMCERGVALWLNRSGREVKTGTLSGNVHSSGNDDWRVMRWAVVCM